MELLLINSIGILLISSMLGQYLGWRLKIPSLVFFIVFGILLGPIFKIINPQESFHVGFNIFVEFAVVILLFEGGLNLKFSQLKEVSFGVKRLTTLGVLANFFIAFYAGQYIGGLSKATSAVIAAILIVTGPTVIIPMLRQAKLPKRISQYLKWEGIINDPLGVLLVTLVYQYITIHDQANALNLVIISFFKAVIFAIIITFAFGRAIQVIFNRTNFPDFLKIPFILSTILIIFIISKQVQEGSGLLAVTGLGMYFANRRLLVFSELKKFKEAISVFFVSIIFILLSASIKFNFFANLHLKQILFILFLTFCARLIAVFTVTFYSKMTVAERIFVGWIGPRGIVAASIAGVIGLRLVNQGYQEAEMILPIVFSVVICTVLTHGLSLAKVAELLKLNVKCGKGLVIVGASQWALDLALKLKELNVRTLVIDSAVYKLQMMQENNIETHLGEAVYELEQGNIDLTEYSYLLSATDSNSYNTLVCNNFATDLSANCVYQIALGKEFANNEGLSKTKSGLIVALDNNNLFNSNIKDRLAQGWHFEACLLNEKYSLEDHLKNHDPELTINLLVVDKEKNIDFITNPEKIDAKATDTIISFSKTD